MKRTVSIMLLLGCAGLWSTPAFARFTCSVSANAVAFGVYDPTFGGQDSTGLVTFRCNSSGIERRHNFTFEVALTAGNSGSFSPRTLSSGTDTLNYNLYIDSGRNTVWGNGNGGSVTRSGNITVPGCFFFGCGNDEDDLTAYGRIPGGQYVSVGSYSDTITVTVTY